MKKIVKKILKYLAAILGTLSLMVIAALIFLHFALKDMCENEIFQTIVSPNKKFKVIVFQRDCGATTGFSTQISLLKATDDLDNESGNIFIADGHPDTNPIKISWLNDKKIEISEQCSETFLRIYSFKNIEILYKK